MPASGRARSARRSAAQPTALLGHHACAMGPLRRGERHRAARTGTRRGAAHVAREAGANYQRHHQLGRTMCARVTCCTGPARRRLKPPTAVMSEDLAGTGVTANVLVPGGMTVRRIVPDAAVADRNNCYSRRLWYRRYSGWSPMPPRASPADASSQHIGTRHCRPERRRNAAPRLPGRRSPLCRSSRSERPVCRHRSARRTSVTALPKNPWTLRAASRPSHTHSTPYESEKTIPIIPIIPTILNVRGGPWTVQERPACTCMTVEAGRGPWVCHSGRGRECRD